ncbi:hypothetical protein HJC23_002782 [Cyclotella cryptica]|uniref:Uncharacterized protein n=1 Tax=Cyclotella cryptica TaxID=29204 RepID=A0ABD3PG77_9STRA|eukprot:CCRYP_015023-RA/>CCRYP_015023-RA protein AED:0.02 eAED:0.02 QI:128/1/1/1/1/1/2/462/697
MKSAHLLVAATSLHAPTALGSLQTSFVPLPGSLLELGRRSRSSSPNDSLSPRWHRSEVFFHYKDIIKGRSTTERARWHPHSAFASRNGDDALGAAAENVTSHTKHKSSSRRVGNKVKTSKGAIADADGSTDAIADRVRVRLRDLAAPGTNKTLKGSEQSNRDRLARAAASLLAQRKDNEANKTSLKSKRLSFSSMSDAKAARARRNNPSWAPSAEDSVQETSQDLIELMQKINQKILRNNWSRSGQRRGVNENNLYDGPNVHTQHATDSMQSLLGYNHFQGEWSDRNATTYHVAIVFGKPLIQDQITVEYATRIRTLAKLLKEEPLFCPKLICFTGGVSQGNTISDATAGYVYFRHLCAAQNVTIDSLATKIWVDTKSSNEREAMERIASELWRNHIKQWLSERPLTERLNQHYGVGWKILERKVDVHFTLVSTEYHLCNLNDVHHRSPVKSFLQPLVSLRGLVGSDRWSNNQELEVMDPSYSSSVHVRGSEKAPVVSERATFGGIENSVDTSWSFQYGTYPFLHGDEESIVFLGQCYLLGEELTPLLVNMKGVVEQTEFFQRDNYYLLSSIRRSLVSLVEALYTEKGQSIRAGVVKHFQRLGRNRFTKEDVKIIVVLESALLNLGRCIDLVKPAGLLVSSVPASTWSRALDALQKSMNQIQAVCDPDQPLEPTEWGKLFDDDKLIIDLSSSFQEQN